MADVCLGITVKGLCALVAMGLTIVFTRRAVAEAALRSMLTLRADELQFFTRQRRIDSALGFSHRLSLSGGLADHGLPLQRKSPFP